ncbi:MAG TPA: oxygen-independent coproporphyrinogen III oxidase [Daejeonella sp.]|nr:oxygen-independent coproporphyrinogen III oxidase [Daejeonella sp.]
MNQQHLIDKYHVPAPRYTSYPTVPYWDADSFDLESWKESTRFSFHQSNSQNGISLYIHLPYCESLCTYCGCNTRITKNHGVEDPYITAVLKEWELYREVFGNRPLIKEIHLGGGTPTFFSPENLEKLINGLTRDSDFHPEAEFSFEAHPNNTTEAHLRSLYGLGFRRLSLGIQDFDPRVQLIINRIQSFEQVKKVNDLARQIGYHSINFDLIYGLPLQTQSGLVETIRKVELLMPDRIAFYSYAHVPWVKPGQRRYTEADLPTPAQKQELYETGRDLFTGMGYEEIGMDHFALPSDSLYQAEKTGKLHRNFMGYTHQYTQLMIGLGVSSISDTWFGFAQNVKKVEEYQDLINRGIIPVFKGHTLSSEDLIIRKHILNLMCQGKTKWNKPEEQCAALHDSLERLKLMEEDGLIRLNRDSMEVLPAGKRFLRNICMALDARLWANQPETQLFSMAG